ncbi:DUF262 domain-containing protein [Lysinibacillus sphaericus]|uniref:DUF262 domain-containing protein n=1 Tax=Lysinibacillus sphaericus TaxID=1421 RepID=UPI0004DF32DF|nr:DUF262 domain-containing protein [Lysinibacillus sphaericus]QPA58342.1 DUF262 domain-containing protein [Lysinibacillus sphaericus]
MVANLEQELSIRGENIQRIYDYYINNKLLINRKYQRKLVWAIEEKQAFIDSILNGFPVPLILLAEVTFEDLSRYEIIDGMQRLNAIMSFIEGEFTYNGKYFDLETMAETKQQLDEGILIQKIPKLDRTLCKNIAGYLLPLSVYKYDGLNHKIDEVFRRINSNGKHLSKQELRLAGATGEFANLIRKLAYIIRGDVSIKETLYLHAMKRISITNKDLEYGINVNDIFWVKEGILRRENVRESKDEEIIADIISYMILSSKPPSNSDVLDDYFGASGTDNKRYIEIESAVKKYSAELVIKQFKSVYGVLNHILGESGSTFGQLLFETPQSNRIPRYFQVVFLALHELVIKRNMEVNDLQGLLKVMQGIGNNHIKLSSGGGKWSAIERENNVNGIRGIFEPYFKVKETQDPAIATWAIELENILMQSNTEQSLYDFKQGFYNLNGESEFNQKSFSKVIKTMTAMVNMGPGNTGYVIIGVADKIEDAITIESLYNVEKQKYNHFYITGIQGEAIKYNKDLDSYYQKIIQLLQKEPIDEVYKAQIARNIRLINYYGHSVLVFKVVSDEHPALYNNEYFERNGPNLNKIDPTQYNNLFKRFYKN